MGGQNISQDPYKIQGRPVKILSSGGLGDALMIYAKMQVIPYWQDAHVTHIEVHRESLDAIQKFWDSQGVSCICICVDGVIKWWEKHKDQFDFVLSSRWNGKGGWPANDWSIFPDPLLKFTKLDWPDVVIQKSAGRHNGRSIWAPDIDRFVNGLHSVTNRKAATIGKQDYNSEGLCNLGDNLINKTSFKEFVDIICSCKTFVGHAGFGAYLAAMAGVEVFMIPETCSANYIHPRWNIKIVKRLGEVRL